MTIIVHGPPGCGKTRNKERLRQHFGATRVVDEWDGKTPLRPGDLALTFTCSVTPTDKRTIRFEDAIRQLDQKGFSA